MGPVHAALIISDSLKSRIQDFAEENKGLLDYVAPHLLTDSFMDFLASGALVSFLLVHYIMYAYPMCPPTLSLYLSTCPGFSLCMVV